MNKDHAQNIITGLEVMGAPLTPEDRYSIEVWTKGRALVETTNSVGWQYVLEIAQDIVSEAIKDLINLAPGSPEVVAAHAAASAASDRINTLFKRIDLLIAEAQEAPEIVRKGIRVATTAPIESL